MAVQINVAANQAALTASIQAGVQAYNQRFAQNNQLNLTVNQRAFSQPLGRMTGDVKDFEAALAASNARVIAFGASTAVLGGVIRSFKELASVTIDVEKNLADINRVFGLTTSQLQKFSTDLFNVSKQTASSFDDASKAALEFSRQGLKAEDTLQRTKDALTLTRLAGISTANAVDALTSTVNGFAATGVTTTQILNKLVAVEQDYAVGAGDLAEALSRTGQAAQEAGVSLDQLNALVTSAQQSTARGGAVIGNALKTIFTRLQRTETLDQLEAFNISVRDVQGNILPAVQILQNFAGAYKGLADAQRAQLSEQVAGVYQVNILKAIVNDLNKSQGVYAGALQRGASATNEAEIATAKLNQTLDALLKQTATSTQQLANNIGKVTFEPLAKYGTEQLKSFVESMNEILEGEGVGSTFANGLLKGIRNVIAGPGAIAAFFTLFKLIQNSFSYLAQALPQIAGITTETQNRKNIEQSILQIMQQQGPVSQALAGTMGNQAAQAQLLLQLARQQTAEYQIQTTLAKQLAVQLAGQGVRVKGSGGLQVTRAGGYIPNATRMAEVVGAQAGGYTPGRVVSSPVGGVMNTAEDVKYIPGFAQPFINPPANSKAGRAHRQNAINRTGVDPYMYGGFIPNFSNPKDVINKSYTGPLHLLQIHSLDEKEEIQKVADLETEITKRGKKQVINDKITGFGIKYVTEEIKGKSNSDYRKEAADLALSGDIEAIKKSMPKTKGSSFNATQWRDNLKDLNDKGINLSSSNIENLSRLENAVPSLITGKTVEFGRQFTGLLNALSGEAFEKDIAKQKKKLFARSEKSNARLDFESLNQLYSGGEAKLGGITLGNLVAKAIESTGRKYDNGDEDKIAFSKPIKLFVPEKHKLLNKGFIPNFAPPTSAIRIPWFKKFGNPAFDAIQPALGISKASDTETFRQINFKSTAEGADERGDSNIFAPLFEDFAFKAMQLVSQPDIKNDLIRGYVLQPKTNQKQSAFDAALEEAGVGIEYKGYPKKNLPGSITGELTRKYETLSKSNPAAAAKLKELIIAFNEVGHENQITSELGKKLFSPLAGVSYSQMVKNSPDLVKGLSAETNSLLNSYVKNPAFLAMAAASGFIPNFAYKQAVMGLEESMSGNKAVFDTKPFPHIRNSSQPTFSSAIADHGGLGNALSDSMRGQKAAGLMSGGFIPNFGNLKSTKNKIAKNKAGNQSQNTQSSFNPNQLQADAERVAQDVIKKLSYAYNFVDGFVQTFITEVGDLSKSAKNNLSPAISKAKSSIGSISNNVSSSFSSLSKKIDSPEFKQKISNLGTTLAFAGPIAAGLIEQTVFGDRKRTDMSATERQVQSGLSTGLTAASTGASIGAAFGPFGAAIGGAAGALVGLTSALQATTLTSEELAQLNQEQVQKSQASISAASSYIEAQKSLTQMISSGASSSDIEIATKKLSDNFNEIKDVKLQEIFNSTGGDVAAMTKQLQDYTNQVTKESAKQTGLYGKNLKPEERASALSLGLGKEGAKSFITSAEAALKEAQKASDIIDKNAGLVKGSTPFTKFLYSLGEADRKIAKKPILEKFAESQVPSTEPDRESKVKALVQNLLDGNFEAALKALEKNINVTEVSKAAANFQQAATRSFNQIFLDVEQAIAKSAFDIALSFEKDSGSRKIQSTILDFSMNFQDSLNSFLSNNLPDVRKFDFTAATAGQKAQMLLQKSQQDYDKAVADQANERANFLNKNSENLTKEFKSSFLQSQASAEFYEKNILPQIQQGIFSGNAQSLAKQFQSASFTEAQAKVGAVGMNLTDVKGVSEALKEVNFQMQILADGNETETETYKNLLSAQKALIDLQNQTALFQNQNEMKKLQTVLNTAAREQELFDVKQANAKKELDINKQLSEARIAADKVIAIEKAKVDKENLMRMESMKDLSANIGNALEISKARSATNVNALQRRLDDQRETFGMGRSQISERKFGIQADILKEQRKAEDAAINAEIQQRVLEMAAEQENTAATLKLNDTIMTLIESQLKGTLGGEEKIKQIASDAKRMGAFAPANIDKKYGSGTYAQFQAIQRIQESRVASAASNTGYNTSNFESNLSSAGFNDKMTQAEQLTFLEKQETEARNAGNIVLAGTIKRYQDQIKAKKQALQITRDDIDAQIKLNIEIEKVNNTFAGRFKKGWGNLKSEGDDLILNLGENLPRMFGDGLVDGIKAAIRESDNLGDALLGVAAKFLDEISTTMMRAGIYQLLGGFGMSIPGVQAAATKQRGGIIRAQSGMYISGTGSGDKYPALLENGEYVLNRNAVMAMGGPSALDSLNFSAAPRFASGGAFNTELSDIKSMEQGMTTFGLENSSLYKELRDAEIQKAEQARQKKRARQAQVAQIVGSLAAAVVTAGIGAGISNKMSNIKAGKAQNLSQKLQQGAPLTAAESSSIRGFMDKGLLSPSGVYTGPQVVRTGFSGFTGYSGRQTGGLIGSRLSDTIPGYMEGGLYNTSIVKKYGTGMQGGGMSSVANNSNVVNNTNASNSFNFNTSVNRDGTIQMGADSTTYKQQDIELSNNLNTKIYGAVLDVIREQQRFGGSLAGTRKA